MEKMRKTRKRLQFGRPRRIWKNNIRINIKMGCEKYIGFISLKIGSSREHGNEPSDSAGVGVLLMNSCAPRNYANSLQFSRLDFFTCPCLCTIAVLSTVMRYVTLYHHHHNEVLKVGVLCACMSE
jgi:hypothetical protein